MVWYLVINWLQQIASPCCVAHRPVRLRGKRVAHCLQREAHRQSLFTTLFESITVLGGLGKPNVSHSPCLSLLRDLVSDIILHQECGTHCLTDTFPSRSEVSNLPAWILATPFTVFLRITLDPQRITLPHHSLRGPKLVVSCSSLHARIAPIHPGLGLLPILPITSSHISAPRKVSRTQAPTRNPLQPRH